jgi:hypothetical protein
VKSSRILVLCSLAALAGLAALTPLAQAAPASAWALRLTPMPSNFAPGSHSEFVLAATNVGAAATSGSSKLEATLPADLAPTAATYRNLSKSAADVPCQISGQLISCETPDPVVAGGRLWAKINVDVAASPAGPSTTLASISGGGAQEKTTSSSPPYQSTTLPFGFLAPGLIAPLSEEDGSPALLAGSHPYQQTVAFGFPTEAPPGDLLSNAGHPHNVVLDLPPGLIGNPAATPVLCTEAQLQSSKCPDGAQLGLFELTTIEGDSGIIGLNRDQIYNMVPPPGSPAELAVNVGGFGLYLHLFASVRSDGDYGIEVSTPDILAFGTIPFFEIQTQVWGDPSSPRHERIRGKCYVQGGLCPVAQQKTAFWTLPGHCGGNSDVTSVHADSWEEPGLFKDAEYESADLGGNPVSSTDCGALGFEPKISAQPTTNLIDSPAGLDVDLHQPQNTELGENGEDRSTAELKDATVTLPAGMSVNPSQADGLGACTTQQIGLTTTVGATPVHFDESPNTCPNAAKLGTVEVTSPLLVQRNDQGALEKDPETGEPIPEALHGSVYLAQPFANPFGSLLALYLAIEDPATGIVSKLAGRVEADPVSGQLSTTFKENPQLPIEDIRLHLFSGARASLITPPICATHTTTTDLTPWSTPEGADATPSNSFQTTASPSGGACPQSEAAAPNAPTFTAGTIGRQAGSYSPFALKISREDGSQRLTQIDTTLPPGLAARFVGVPYCSEAQIAAAKAREHANEGILERQSPSCPAASELGTVNVGAGAGPTPFYTQGHVYLAGPYKGAPLSLVIITPAIAGPFDLGNVVVRTALQVDPATAQGRAVSDPLPTIIDGIPLDVRSIAIRLDRPSFTLNPTSCDPLAITGDAISALGASAALTTPFQVGGCSTLAFKPKLAIKLTGPTKRSGNPALKATLTMPLGGANIARTSVALPHSEFLDQAHIRTICTRVQFAEGGGHGAGCPAGSVYGKARAITPLLDAPLEGPVYLRANGGERELPDLVAALHGQIDVELSGYIDSVNGGIRTTFATVPDAPVSKFVLEMQGGKKGLLENSTNLCKSTNKATAKFDAQNGKFSDFKPVVKNSCKGKKGGGKKGKKSKRQRRGA